MTPTLLVCSAHTPPREECIVRLLNAFVVASLRLWQTAADTQVEPDQPSPAATGPSPGGMNKQHSNNLAGANAARPRVSASRRALEVG